MLSVFGEIKATPLPATYRSVTTGLPIFISNIVRLIMIGAGIFAFINLVIAGLLYVTSAGDEKKVSQALASINMSLIGLVVLIASFAITGIVSYILFGDATAILQPTIYGPGSE